MRISDNEIKKLQDKSNLVKAIVEAGHEAEQREADRELIRRVTKDVINMPDREDMIAELKAKIDAGLYNPTGDDIADAMIRRNIADRIQ